MKHPQTPLGIALFSLAICLGVGVLVIAAAPGVLHSPSRLSILVAVAIGVPVANYLMSRARRKG